MVPKLRVILFKLRNLRRLRRSQGRWGIQRGAMQCSPLVAVRANLLRAGDQ